MNNGHLFITACCRHCSFAVLVVPRKSRHAFRHHGVSLVEVNKKRLQKQRCLLIDVTAFVAIKRIMSLLRNQILTRFTAKYEKIFFPLILYQLTSWKAQFGYF